MSVPNLVYKSLNVRYIVFFYYYKFGERDDVGACCNSCLGAGCNTLTVEQIVRILGVKIMIQAPKLACDISIVIKSIPSDWLIENPRWRPFSKMATNK